MGKSPAVLVLVLVAVFVVRGEAQSDLSSSFEDEMLEPRATRLSRMRLKKMSMMRLKKADEEQPVNDEEDDDDVGVIHQELGKRMSMMRLKKPSLMRLRRGPSMMRLKKMTQMRLKKDCFWFKGWCLTPQEMELHDLVRN